MPSAETRARSYLIMPKTPCRHRLGIVVYPEAARAERPTRLEPDIAATIQIQSDGRVLIHFSGQAWEWFQLDTTALAIAVRSAELTHRGKSLWPVEDMVTRDGPPDAPHWRFQVERGQLYNYGPRSEPTAIPFQQLVKLLKTEISDQLIDAWRGPLHKP